MRTIVGPMPISPTFWTGAVRVDPVALLVGVAWRFVDFGYVIDVRPLPGVVLQLTRSYGRIPMPMPRSPHPYDLPEEADVKV